MFKHPKHKQLMGISLNELAAKKEHSSISQFESKKRQEKGKIKCFAHKEASRGRERREREREKESERKREREKENESKAC